MSTTGSSAISAIPADTHYESLYEISKKAFPDIDVESCCSSRDEENCQAGEGPISSLELHEEALRKSCEVEIRQFAESTDAQQSTTTTDAVPLNTATHQEKSATAVAEIPLQDDQSSHQRHLAISEPAPDLPLEIGDHVYQWRSFMGVPGVFQHHGIVMDTGVDENGEIELEIADFSCLLRAPSSSNNNPDHSLRQENQSVDMLTGNQPISRPSNLHPQGILRVYKSSSGEKWHKVVYKASVWKTSLWRSGTATAVESDPPGKVLART